VRQRRRRLTFTSGLGDLWNPWAPARDESQGRLAILSRPSPGDVSSPAWSFNRWATLAHLFRKAAEVSEPARAGSLKKSHFVDEGEARAFLLAEESEATKSEPSP